MAKSRAEIQKAYRERKKAREGQTYKDKETARVKKYYKPTVSLTKTQLNDRRRRTRRAMRRLRQKRTQQHNDAHDDDVVNTPEADGPCDSTSASTSTLTRYCVFTTYHPINIDLYSVQC